MSRFRGLVLAAVCLALPAVVRGADISLDGQIFTLPDGFTIEVIARPPLVNRPVTGDFDEEGRLYVSDSSGSNDKVAEATCRKAASHSAAGRHRWRWPLRSPHRVRGQDDVPRGDDVADGSLYVSAPPTIWKLTDTNGDGVADQRQEWLTRQR